MVKYSHFEPKLGRIRIDLIQIVLIKTGSRGTAPHTQTGDAAAAHDFRSLYRRHRETLASKASGERAQGV
jgi:hypothetical protein